MRKLVLILIAFIAVVTFIRAVDNAGNESRLHSESAELIPSEFTQPEFTP